MSGRSDLNRGPLVPEATALTGLSYALSALLRWRGRRKSVLSFNGTPGKSRPCVSAFKAPRPAVKRQRRDALLLVGRNHRGALCWKMDVFGSFSDMIQPRLPCPGGPGQARTGGRLWGLNGGACAGVGSFLTGCRSSMASISHVNVGAPNVS
jgi:hypothetical protein